MVEVARCCRCEQPPLDLNASLLTSLVVSNLFDLVHIYCILGNVFTVSLSQVSSFLCRGVGFKKNFICCTIRKISYLIYSSSLAEDGFNPSNPISELFNTCSFLMGILLIPLLCEIVLPLAIYCF